MERHITGAHSARWGAACDPCAKAKARCHRSNRTPGAVCDRCRSLDRSCIQQAPKPRKKRVPKLRKTSHLEEKVNHLIDSLKQQGQSLPFLDSYSSDSSAHDSSTGQTSSQHPVDEEEILNGPMPGFSPFARQPCTCQAIPNKQLSPLESDENLLSIHKNQLSLQFPFVIISSSTTAVQLKQVQPFLMKVIRMVASIRHRDSMWGQKHAVMQHISDAVIMRSERSLDLIQGLLLFSGHYNYYCLAHGQFNHLIHLTMSMIEDMGLDRRTRPHERTRYAAIDPKEPRGKINEERRILVGAWYMSSNAALTFSKLESPRYTKNLDQCLNELEVAAEYETDQLLVQLVRIQSLTERIFQFNCRDQRLHEFPALIPSETSSASYLSVLQAELEKFQCSLPEKLKSNYLLASHYYTAQVRLLEPQLTRANPLNAAVTAALRTWFEKWLAIPIYSYFYMPMSGFGDLIYTVTILARRARIIVMSWDYFRANTTTQVNPQVVSIPSGASIASVCYGAIEDLMLDVLESLAARFSAARVEMGAMHGGEWNNDLLDQAAKRLRIIKARIERWSKIVAAGGEDSTPRKEQIGRDINGGEEENIDSGKAWLEQLDGLWLDDYSQESWLWTAPLFDGMGINYGDGSGS